MCLQIKQGFTLCPHVFCDLCILKCRRSRKGECCDFERTGIPDWIWGDTRMEGKCLFCELEESDQRDRRRRTRKLDLDYEDDRENEREAEHDNNYDENHNNTSASRETD
jgi:hypothetical protein